MEGICLNLLEAKVTLYPANADGSPQLTSPIFAGADAENLRGLERWLKKETTPSGARHPRRHLLVPTYEVSIGRVWVMDDTLPLDWQAQYSQYVLDIVWVEEETLAWHRKTFYGVTISEHGWDGKDVENGFIEHQVFEAEYLITDGGPAYTGQTPLPATLPYRVIYTDANGGILLYTYASGLFTAQASTTGRATITTGPFAITFDGDSGPVVSATDQSSPAYRNTAAYRTANTYRQNYLTCAGVFAQVALPGDLPRLDFYYGDQKVFTVTRAGIFEMDFIEAPPSGPAAGAYAVYGGASALLAVFTRGNLTATSINVTG